MTYIPQPVALRLAEMLEQGARLLLKQRSVAAAGELRRQHTRIAAMRCLVASHIGDEIEVPEELA